MGWHAMRPVCATVSVCVCARTRSYSSVPCGSDVCECTRGNKDTVVHLAPSRGHCMAFSSTIPPLQVALSFACSVASLSHSLSFQLPGWRNVHCGSLAEYTLGWGRTSTCTMRHIEFQYITTSTFSCGPPNIQLCAGDQHTL